MCGFVIKNAKTKAHNKEQLGQLFRNIKPTDKSIMLGLVAGLRPTITTQLYCELKAAELWDLQFEPLLSKSLDELKLLTPINKMAIMKIAEDVYTRRHRTDIFQYFFSVARVVIGEDDRYAKADRDTLFNQFLAIFGTIADQNRDTSALRAMDDYQIFALIDYAIKNSCSNLLPEIERFGNSTIRSIIYNGLNVILGCNYYPFYNDLKGIEGTIDDIFSNDLFSEKAQYSCIYKDLSYFASILNHVSWDYKGSHDIYNDKPSLESFDAIPSSNNNFDAVQVMMEEDTEIKKHHVAFEKAMNEYHGNIQRLNKVTDLNQQLLEGAEPLMALESLKEIFPNLVNIPNGPVSQEYALEEFSETLKNIVHFIIEHIHKIIPILISLVVALSGYILKRRAINLQEENIKNIQKVHEKSIQKLKDKLKESHIPELPLEEVIVNPLDWRFYEHSKLILHYEMDKLILNHAPGYTEVGIMETLKAHFKLLTELVEESREMVKLLNELMNINSVVYKAKTVSEVSSIVRRYESPMQKLKSVLLHDNHDFIPFTRKPMFKDIVKFGGHTPNPENNLHFTKLVNREIYHNYSHEADDFWSGDYSEQEKNTRTMTTKQPFLAHYDVYCNRGETGTILHDPLHQLAPFEELDDTLKPDFTKDVNTLKSIGEGAQSEINKMLTANRLIMGELTAGHVAEQVVAWPKEKNGDIRNSTHDKLQGTAAHDLFKRVLTSNVVKNKSIAIQRVIDSLMDVKRLYDRVLDINTIAKHVRKEDCDRIIKYNEYLENLRSSL